MGNMVKSGKGGNPELLSFYQKRQVGFSLPEVIAVLAIVGVLMAIAVPAALSQRQKGVETAQRGDLLNAVTAVEKILNTYKGAPPEPVIITTNTSTSTWEAKLNNSSTVLETGKVSSGTVITGITATPPTGCNVASPTAQKVADCGGYTAGDSPPMNTAIWPNGSYCVQSVNSNSSRTNLSYNSRTLTVETALCSGNAPAGGVGTTTQGAGINLPPAPGNVAGSSTASNTITLTWNPSVDPATAPVTGYVIEVPGRSPFNVARCTPSCSATVTEVPGTSDPVTVAVRGRNANGVGPSSTASVSSVQGPSSIEESLSVPTALIAGQGVDSKGTGSAILGNTQYNAADVRFSGSGQGAPNNGYLIRTNIPSSLPVLPVVRVQGVADAGSTPVDVTISWKHENPPSPGVFSFGVATYTNTGAWDTGTIRLGRLSNGNIAIHIPNNTSAMRFTVTVNPYPSDPSYVMNTSHFSSWTVAESNFPADANTLTNAAVKYIAGQAPLVNPTFSGNVVVPNADAGNEAVNRDQVVGIIGESPTWINLTLINGWQPFPIASGNDYGTPQYTKTRDGKVILRGVIRKPTAPDTLQTVIAILPDGYRPSKNVIFNQASAGGVVRVDVTATGQIIPWTYVGGSSSFISLNGIEYYIN